ncbi:hypothetical protein MW887_008648 [Aspergillus wentii]|nr:hypothetical protein MW887_008648 [Aspergillus wentii]
MIDETKVGVSKASRAEEQVSRACVAHAAAWRALIGRERRARDRLPSTNSPATPGLVGAAVADAAGSANSIWLLASMDIYGFRVRYMSHMSFRPVFASPNASSPDFFSVSLRTRQESKHVQSPLALSGRGWLPPGDRNGDCIRHMFASYFQ